MDALSVAIVAAAVAMLIAVAQGVAIHRLRRRIRDSEARRRGGAARHGRTMEHLAPWAAQWPGNPRGFRFIGDPIDGVQFNDDGILIVEIKAGRGRLSPVQRRVRDHVQAGRVEWREIRI